MMQRILRLFLILYSSFFISFAEVHAADQFVCFQPETGAVKLTSGTIRFNDADDEGVKIAIHNLQRDMKQTIGTELSVLVGTLGRNAEIDRLEKNGQLPGLKGCREKYFAGIIDGQFVIAGSDRRGTIYGIYEFSRQLGVSPWYWWADVPAERHDAAYVRQGLFTDGEPVVEYRGIFLNDEAPCLTSWVKNTFGTNYGDHRFYERVFELILRLKGNLLWPAMWSWAFYADDPENAATAHRMGVIIGTSHHEPMARNHQEYARHRKEWGPWNYQTNQKGLDRFFREGIERMKGMEQIVTIGMRGDGDEAMSEDADTRLLQRIVSNQRKIIKQATGRPASETPQVWALYKEVMDYYDKGMRVPDDVIMLLCDDNWGNVRRVPATDRERAHKGGWGLYYHVDYVGAPRNSKWINATPSQHMWEQLTLAHQYGIDRLWILNVGDLKPMEYPIQLFLDMAWDPTLSLGLSKNPSLSLGSSKESVNPDPSSILEHTRRFCSQQFGDSQADEAARILNRLCKLNGRSTAEMLDASTYDLVSGEWQRVADDYMRLEAEALRQFITLPETHRDAYREIILFPLQAMSNLHQMYYAQAQNLALAANGDPEANLWADRVAEAFHRDSLLCAAYNEEIAGGKWRGMMTQKHIGYRSWNDNFPHDLMPRVKRIDNPSAGGYVFQPRDGYMAIEAEHFYDATDARDAHWTVIPDMGRTLSAVALMPYDKPINGAQLSYRFRLDKASDVKEVKVHVIVRSTLDIFNKDGMAYSVTLDGGEPQRVVFNDRLNESKENVYSVFYPTVARRVVEKVVTLPLPSAVNGLHTLTLRPLEPAIVFEKIVVDLGGYRPQYLFGTESPRKIMR